MGDKSTATQRLNLAQSFNPLGLILGLLVAQQFVLKNLQSDDIKDFSALGASEKIMIRSADLMVIRDPYVILGLVVILVFILIAIAKMPQAKDDDEMAPLNKTFKPYSTIKTTEMELFHRFVVLVLKSCVGLTYINMLRQLESQVKQRRVINL